MDRLNKIERLKDALHDTDYKAIKHSEGWLSEEDYAETKAERQAIRNEINTIEAMTEDEFYEAYPEEREEEVEVPNEELEPNDEPYELDVVGLNNEEEGASE